MTMLLHATVVAIGGRGVALVGRSSSGKSDLALRLIDRGAALVGDDYVELMVDGTQVTARAPATIAGRIEVRGIGLVEMAHLDSAPLALFVELDSDVERLPEDHFRELLGRRVPAVALGAFEASAAIKIELALKRTGLPLEDAHP